MHGEAKRHLRYKGKPRHRKGREERRGKIPISRTDLERPTKDLELVTGNQIQY